MNPIGPLPPLLPRRRRSRSWREAFYVMVIFFSVGLAWQAWSERELRQTKPRMDPRSASDLEFEHSVIPAVGRSLLVRAEPGSLIWVESQLGAWQPDHLPRVVRAQPVLAPRGVVEITDLRSHEYVIRAQAPGGSLLGVRYVSQPGAAPEIDLRPQFRVTIDGAFRESATQSPEQRELFESRSTSLARGEHGEVGIVATCSIRADGERVTFRFTDVPARTGDVFRLIDAAHGAPFGPRIVASGPEVTIEDFVVELEPRPLELPIVGDCGLAQASVGPKTIRAYEEKSAPTVGTPSVSLAGKSFEIARIRTSPVSGVSRSRCVVIDCFDAETGEPATEGRTRVRIVDRTEEIPTVIEFEVAAAARIDVTELLPERRRLNLSIDRDGYYATEVNSELPGDDGLPVILSVPCDRPRIRPLSLD